MVTFLSQCMYTARLFSFLLSENYSQVHNRSYSFKQHWGHEIETDWNPTSRYAISTPRQDNHSGFCHHQLRGPCSEHFVSETTQYVCTLLCLATFANSMSVRSIPIMVCLFLLLHIIDFYDDITVYLSILMWHWEHSICDLVGMCIHFCRGYA